MTTLREKLIKIGAKVVRHARQVIFQMAEVVVPRELLRAILEGDWAAEAVHTGAWLTPAGRKSLEEEVLEAALCLCSVESRC